MANNAESNWTSQLILIYCTVLIINLASRSERKLKSFKVCKVTGGCTDEPSHEKNNYVVSEQVCHNEAVQSQP